jgi:hypothetical protein
MLVSVKTLKDLIIERHHNRMVLSSTEYFLEKTYILTTEKEAKADFRLEIKQLAADKRLAMTP